MSETLSQDPDGLGGAYTTLGPSYPSTPATPSSTVQDVPPGANLPPFSTFSSEIDSSGTFSSVSDRLFSDTRLLDISNWDYYTETRLVDRGENGLSIISSQPQYRPWESKPVDSTSTFAGTTCVNTFTDSFSPQNGASKLPSFQSQFQAFSESGATGEPVLTTLTNLTPVSPNSASSPQSQTLTTLNSSFHTLSAVNPRSYPLVPAPIQAREIPSIQQQFLDERHIQLYSHPTANLTLNNTIHSANIFPTQNGTIIQNSQIISSPTVVTVLKSDTDLKLGSSLATLHQSDPSTLKLQNVALHPTQFQNPMTILNSDSGLYNGIEKKINGSSAIMTSPTRNEFRKKERRKIRANSLESSAESDGASSNMEMSSENSGQVAAVSSTDGFKTQHGLAIGLEHDISGGAIDKQVKKKRKRCGECIGCQRKDNCGDCAPCRNDKSHQICKQRRCEKLTEKKNLYGEPYMRGESRRGRGKGRGAASYRGRKPNGPITTLNTGGISSGDSNGGPIAPPQQPSSRPSPQPVTQPLPVQQQPMTPMPFYADPNRFPTPVWQADPSQVSGWQGQFIQQIPAAGQAIESYQQYPNGIYQTTYQQPAFETNAFYTGAVQVLTPANTRPPSTPNQQAQMVPPRPNSNYAHTPSPSPANHQQQQTQQQQQNTNRQYQEYNQFGSSSSTTEGSQSRPSSVNSIVNQNPSTPNQNYQQGNQQQTQQAQPQQQTVYTTVSTANFSPGPNTQQTQFVNANSGNGQPGYPQVNASSPQVVSHNSSGYPGNEQYGGQQNQTQQWQQQNHEHILWEQQTQHQHQVHDGRIEQRGYQQSTEQQNNSHTHNITQQSNDQSENIPTKNMRSESPQKTFSQADKVNLNTRIKTMILNKHQNDAKMEQEMKNVEQNQTTGHFLWYSHHHHLDPLGVDGGPLKNSLPNCDKNSARQNISNNTQRFAQNNIKSTNSFRTYKKFLLDPTTAETKELLTSTNVKPKHVNVIKHSLEHESPNNIIQENGSYYKTMVKDNDKVTPSDFIHNPREQEKVCQRETIICLAKLPGSHDKQGNSYVPADTNRFSKQPTYNNYKEAAFGATMLESESPSTSCTTPEPTTTQNNFVERKFFLEKYLHSARSPSALRQPSLHSSSTTKHSVLDSSQLTTGQFAHPVDLFNSQDSIQCKYYEQRDKTIPQIHPEKANVMQTHFIPSEDTKLWLHEKETYLPAISAQPSVQRYSYLKDKSDAHIKPKSAEKLNKTPPKIVGEQIPQCHCFPPDQSPSEPGTYYTHLGCANSLRTLRHNLECRTGLSGSAIRIEKVRYTGKEGKTAQGCPIVKWVHRRVSIEEKYLVIVKHRTGHTCHSAFIVVCLVVWDGVLRNTADELYSLLSDKLNKFGLPTKRRCATNEDRTCACQGIDEATCGASFTFGCSWSMYYNGCKFTRSKDVRKFRLSVKEEETIIEEKLQNLADYVSPIYRTLVPESFKNQTSFENVAAGCRLGTKPGRPFSGVTACIDFCAHAHKDIHNMNDGCTVVVTLTKHRDLLKPEDEQLHVLPLYVPDDTDEFGSKENQDMKVSRGELEVLNKYECMVRTFSEPECRGRKNKKEETQKQRKSSKVQPSSSTPVSSSCENFKLQSSQVSSTVLDSPVKNSSWRYDSLKCHENDIGVRSNGNNFSYHLPQFSVFQMPHSFNRNSFSYPYNQASLTPNLLNHFSEQHVPLYQVNNPFDDHYTNNTLSSTKSETTKHKSVDIRYTDNNECFHDREMGGVAIALTHGSVLFECAKHELHATTALKDPDRTNPTRISLVFYQHRSLNKPQHGLEEYTLKQKFKNMSSCYEKKTNQVLLRATTLPTFSVTTMFPMHPCVVTGPYQEPYPGAKSMPNK